MNERVEESGLVEFIRDLFTDADTESMIRWMLVAWLVFAVAAVAFDRVSTALLGRSRPLLQRPPGTARDWRWRRALPPSTYSMLPSGTTVSSGTPPRVDSIPLATHQSDATVTLALPAAPLSNAEYWLDAANPASPVFGYENVPRLQDHRPPERYNPILLAIEVLQRDEETGDLSWPSEDDVLRLGFDRNASLSEEEE